jgi:hypothetical protein
MRQLSQQACLGPVLADLEPGGWPRIDKEILFGSSPRGHMARGFGTSEVCKCRLELLSGYVS